MKFSPKQLASTLFEVLDHMVCCKINNNSFRVTLMDKRGSNAHCHGRITLLRLGKNILFRDVRKVSMDKMLIPLIGNNENPLGWDKCCNPIVCLLKHCFIGN